MLYQSTRHEAYRAALQTLAQQGLSYRCTCSRQELQGETLYNGHCRTAHHDEHCRAAIRLNVNAALQQLHENPLVHFNDRVQGPQQQNLLTEVGDFVIHRKDGLFAYQLAVVVDDIFQHVTHVIRGADLLDSTARQILLYKLLKASSPVFGHIPLVLNEDGQKLSKQNLAPALDDRQVSDNLYRALCFLTPSTPAALQRESQEDSLMRFVEFVVGDAQDVWTQLLGPDYRRARLVLFRGAVQSSCGYAQAAMGPFYCPADEKVYI